jgi:hypothetical protein
MKPSVIHEERRLRPRTRRSSTNRIIGLLSASAFDTLGDIKMYGVATPVQIIQTALNIDF